MKYIIVILMLIGNSLNANAQWQIAGFLGCQVHDLAFDGPNIYAGTLTSVGTGAGGVYLSTNGGSTWNQINNGLPLGPASYVNSIVIIGTHIFAATSNAGIFLSTNNGNSWSAVNNGLSTIDVRSLAVSGTTVFAGTSSQGVYKSIDYGNTWTNTNCPGYNIRSLFVSGSNLYVGTMDFGILLSPNNGGV